MSEVSQVADQSIITQVGEAIILAEPDRVCVTGGVVAFSATAAESLGLNSLRMREILSSLERLGVEKTDIKTVDFSVSEHYKSVINSSREIEKVKDGYLVSNRVKVTVSDLPRIGSIIDAMVKAGANTIGDIVFFNSNTNDLLDRARAEAVDVAIRRATIIASSLGYLLDSVVTVQESSSSRGGGPRIMAFAESPTPIMAGSQEFRVAVTVTWRLVPKHPRE